MICPCSGDCDRSACEAYRDGTLGALLRRNDRDDDRRNRSRASRAGFLLRRHAGQAAEDSRSDQLFHRAETRRGEPRASRRRSDRHRGARADGAADAQRRQHDVCFRHRRRWRGARRRRARCRGRDGDVHFRAAARSGRASAAHRVYGPDQQVRPRPLLRRLSDRQRREAAIDQQARAGGRAADISVLGRAGLQGEFRPDREGAAPFPRGRQHAGRARRAARAEPEERHFRADAEDVDLPVRADGRRTGAHHGGGGRRDDRCRRHHRQGCARAIRARQRGETAGLVQRLFRRQISAAQARPDRGAWRLRRRDGELGRHHLLREPAAVRSRNKSGQRAARHLRHHCA